MLKRLVLTDFRNYPQLDFQPSPRLSLVTGANGSGKTSLLESIYTLSTGRSFRSSKPARMVRDGAETFFLFAETEMVDGQTHHLGMSRNRQGLDELKINGKRPQGLSEMALLLPVQVFHPDSSDLIYEDASFRRAFLDWGLFHVEQSFLPLWRRFRQLLANRNALLRSRVCRPAELDAWDQQLVEVSVRIDGLRRAYLHTLLQIRPFLPDIGSGLDLAYYPGWAEDESFAGSLFRHREMDLERGFTSVGPHRADLRIRVKEGLCRDVLSRGQCKLLTYRLLLLQLKGLLADTRKECLLLVDDFDSELDLDNRSLLFKELTLLGQQMIVTSLEKSDWLTEAAGSGKKDVRVFHVEQWVKVNS